MTESSAEITDLTHGRIMVRLIADALELQQHTRQPKHLIAVPGTKTLVTIGTPEDIMKLLPMIETGCIYASDSRHYADLAKHRHGNEMQSHERCADHHHVPPGDSSCVRVTKERAVTTVEHDHSEGGHHD